MSDDNEAMVMMSIRIPVALRDRADRLVARMTKDPLTRSVGRSDVLRAALEAGLDALERRARRR